MKKIKVLQMPVRNAKGGITQYALRNWAHIDKSRLIFDWVTLDKELSFEKDLIDQGCKVHHLSCRQEDDESRFRAEMEAIFANKYDAIHLHTSYWRGFLAEELAIQAKIPRIIVHAHSTGIDVVDSVVREKLAEKHNEWKSRFNTGLATHFVACSDVAAKFLFGPQIPDDRITVLKNAIDTAKFSFDNNIRAEMRCKMGLEDKFVILQAARLEHQKNHTFALKLFAEVLSVIPKAIFLLAGDGQLRDELKKEAVDLGIADKVCFLGFRNDVSALLQAADLMVAPSLFEGFSISAIEAQCSGIHFCCNYCCIPDEAMVLDSTVRLPLDMSLWRDEIVKIAHTGYERRDRSEDIAAAGYSLSEQIKVLESIYSGVIYQA